MPYLALTLQLGNGISSQLLEVGSILDEVFLGIIERTT